MFPRLFVRINRNVIKQIRLCAKLSDSESVPQVVDNQVNSNDFMDTKPPAKSVLDKTDEDLSDWAPNLRPTFNFAAYVNESETLQQLVKMGVNLHNIEKKVHHVEFIMRLDFDRDVKKYVTFFCDLGLSIENVAAIISKNPAILKEDLDNLHVRINFLQAKKFSKTMIYSILSRNPLWLSFATQQINDRLGFFQKEFELTGDQTRALTVQQPRIITHDLERVKRNIFALKEEMGFTPDEMKSILLEQPYIFMKGRVNLVKTFDYLHSEMKISLEKIAQMPGVLLCREFKLRERHLFLKKLDRDQYNYKQPNYVSLLALVSGTDAEFCDKVAKTSVQTFNDFLKTL